MNLRLVRTSSFRLTLRYAALTFVSLLVLFVVILWSATNFMRHQIDITVDAEIGELLAAAGDDDLPALQRIVESTARESGGFFYQLQNAKGDILVGDLPKLEPVVGIRNWRRFHALNEKIELRGRGTTAAQDSYLFVGTNAHEVHELRESITRSFLFGVAGSMLIVLVGGAALSFSVLRRIEAVSQTSRDIVGGDLKRRIALSGSQDEFDHLAESLNAMLDRIQLLMDGLRQVSTDIAHDLRTPLTRLRQRLELAQARAPDAAALHAMLGDTLIEVDAILQTFSALLRIAQVESGARRASFARVDLSELLQTVAEVYQPAFDEHRQLFTVSVERELSITGDRELLTQLFANLLENASRHCPAASRIALSATATESNVEVIVADDGPGIPAEMREKVLQRFVRLDASRSTLGDGLGLSMAAAVAVLHDAPLQLLDNAPGLRVVLSFAKTAKR